MPVQFDVDIKCLSPSEFKERCYDLMNHIFEVHNDFGRLFDEKIYQRELLLRIENALCEVPIKMVFEDFCKIYYLDLLIGGGILFELKTVESLQNRHRGQLLNYLFITGLPNGKLVNFRTERVEHEFVNNPLRLEDRRNFEIVADDWDEMESQQLFDRMIALLHDWGTGLELGLYEEAAMYLCSQPCVETDVEILHDRNPLGVQRMNLASPKVAMRITALPFERQKNYEVHLHRFLDHANLDAIQWINVTRAQVRFKTIRKDGKWQ